MGLQYGNFFIYMLWSFLPVLLFIAGCWAFIKNQSSNSGGEDTFGYFRHTLFCTAILIFSIIFSEFGYNFLARLFTLDKHDPGILRVIIYPFFLTMAAKLQDIFIENKKSETAVEMQIKHNQKW